MANNASLKDKAIDFIRQAVAEDNAANYQQAIDLYTTAISYLSSYVKYERNPMTKEVVNKKIEEYLNRAEELKRRIAGNVTAVLSSNATPGPNAPVLKQKGNDENVEKGDQDAQRIQEQISQVIISEKPNVLWDDVAGLESAKEALKEAVILPIEYPQFFTGERKAWSGFLLYGPPGTGKSFLAKAVATEAKSTFFSVSASTLLSKWMGESEKLVALLFTMAHEKAPSIIFIDEIDSLCGARGGAGEHETSRRIKNEILVRMQGVDSSKRENVLVMAATNLPYQLDQAIRRRFDRRIYIPLPESDARAKMFEKKIGETPHSLQKEDFVYLGQKTDGFTGSDIAVIVKDVLFQPIRKVQDATHFCTVSQADGSHGYMPCSPGTEGAFEATLRTLADAGYAKNVIPPLITCNDFERVLSRTRPTVSTSDLEIYEEYTKEFGEQG